MRLEAKPWLYGPLEVFVHGIEHYFLGSEKDFRFALVHCDNAAELAMKVFIQFHNPQVFRKIRKDWRDISRNFERLVEVVKNNCFSFPNRLASELNYHHSIRNQLYHGGHLSARKRDVSNSIRCVIELFRILFGDDMERCLEAEPYGKNILTYAELESLFQSICKKKRVRIDKTRGMPQMVASLIKKKVILQEVGERIEYVIELRERIVETSRSVSEDDLYKIQIMLDEIMNELQKI